MKASYNNTQRTCRSAGNLSVSMAGACKLLLGLIFFVSTISQVAAQELSERRIHCMGQSWRLPIRTTDKKEIVLLPAEHHVLSEIARALGQDLEWSKSDNSLVGDDNRTLTLGQKDIEINGRTVELEVPPQLVSGEVHVPSDGLEGVLDCRVTVKPGRHGAIYVEPVLTGMNFLEASKPDSMDLQLKTSVPVRKKIFTLKNPRRTVVDLIGVALPKNFESEPHPILGEIRVGQFELGPSITRIVVPSPGGVRVKQERTLDLFEHRLAVSWPSSMTPAEVPKQGKAKTVAIKPVAPNSRQPVVKIKPYETTSKSTPVVEVENPDTRVSSQSPEKEEQQRPTLNNVSWEGSRLKLEFSQPVGYSWSRVNAGKKRFVVDFPGVVFPQRKTSLDSSIPGLQLVRVVQNMPEPQPVVRLVCDLQAPVAVEAEGAKEKFLYLSFPGRQVSAAEYPKGMGHTSKEVTVSGKGRTICIDAGHGGSDPGALNRSVGINEKQVTLDIATKLAQLLKKQGWNVIMTRSSDRDVSWAGSSAKQELGARARVANDYGADLFVSIHANASVNPGINGTSIHWYKSADYRLAKLMEGGVMGATGRKNRGLVKNRFYVLAHTQMPAVLVETAFLTNSTEGRLLADPDYRSRIARGIASGLQIYAARTFPNAAAKN